MIIRTARDVLTLRTPANVLTDRAGRRYSGGEKDIKLEKAQLVTPLDRAFSELSGDI